MIIMVSFSVCPLLKKTFMVIVKNLENRGKAKTSKQKERNEL